MVDLEDELEELEENFDEAEQEFENLKTDEASEGLQVKQEKAEDLIKEIRGQIEFLHEQMNNPDE
jgi:septation ring formation regulator EzrA